MFHLKKSYYIHYVLKKKELWHAGFRVHEVVLQALVKILDFL